MILCILLRGMKRRLLRTLPDVGIFDGDLRSWRRLDDCYRYFADGLDSVHIVSHVRLCYGSIRPIHCTSHVNGTLKISYAAYILGKQPLGSSKM